MTIVSAVSSTSEGYVLAHLRYFLSRAEGERFELSVGCPTLAFQASALDHYANPPSGAIIGVNTRLFHLNRLLSFPAVTFLKTLKQVLGATAADALCKTRSACYKTPSLFFKFCPQH